MLHRVGEWPSSSASNLCSFGGVWEKESLIKVESMPETREVMGMREASEYLGVSRETLYKYVYEEKIPAFKLGNRWKFKKTVLDRWMERQSTQFGQRAMSRRRVNARQGV
jgi:excisionase family DNA binding protein